MLLTKYLLPSLLILTHPSFAKPRPKQHLRRKGPLKGTYTPVIDFASPLTSFTPTSDDTCLVRVPIELQLDGDIEGKVDSMADVHLQQSCQTVDENETSADVFVIEGSFAGFIRGEIAVAKVTFVGTTSESTEVEGIMKFEGPRFGELEVAGILNVGGDYKGRLSVI